MAENPKFAEHKIGRGTYGSPRVLSWRDGTALEIGSFCSISDSVTIMLGGEHRTDWVTTYPFSRLFPEAAGFRGHPHTKGDVVIGNDVWVGYGALILSGVRIGDGAVVAARSVVRGNVEPYSIVAGNPSRHVKFRFDEATVGALQEIAWWDWPMAKIKEAWPLLLADDIDAFIAAYGVDAPPASSR
ncbi:MAG: CatB-related O-acetyltransferase [Pyrinomonadaceae bacterium]